ncbi:MAG: hypothetical protein IKQ58_09610 [Prevotella sp.]|nr:hypothetical protein [Prevotella sp.]
MKTIINTAPPVVMTTMRTPLTVMLSVGQVDNKPLTQAQDTQQNLWYPDRSRYPLILEPVVNILDVDAGQTIQSGYDIRWYYREGSGSETLVTSYTASDNYYLETSAGSVTGRLVVRKNVDYLTPVDIICRVEYTDNLRGETYRAEKRIPLTSENKPEEFYTVAIAAPVPVHYNPIIDAASRRTLRAVARRGQTDVSSSTGFFWYASDAGGDTLLNAQDHPFYVSGQGTDTLVVDAELCDRQKIKVMIATNTTAAAPDLPCTDMREIVWKWPDMEAMPYSMNGSAVGAGEDSKIFGAVVQADGLDVPEAKCLEYCRLRWFSHPMNGTEKTDRGWGTDIIIPASELRRNDTVNTEVYPDLYLLGPLEVLTDDGGSVLDDDSGSATASDYGGAVVGRV